MIKLPLIASNHPSLVGIIRFPSCTFTEKEVTVPMTGKSEIEGASNKYFSYREIVSMAEKITSNPLESESVSIPKNEITDFYPYTYYVLTDGEAEPLLLKPQYLPNTFKVKSKYALSHQPVERYYVEGYKGDNEGNVYNITNFNMMMLPTATNEGLAYLNANASNITQSRKNTTSNHLLNASTSLGLGALSLATGDIMQGAGLMANAYVTGINGLNAIKSHDSRVKDLLLTPNTISSYGTPSTRKSFNTDCVKLLKYTVHDKYKQKIKDFVSRYGYKYNSYGQVDLKSYKGYIKFINPNIDGQIDNLYINKIIEILERGVYIE